MIPALPNSYAENLETIEFVEELVLLGFRGDISMFDSDRTVMATDNSIYQRVPQGVVYPRGRDDLVLIGKLLAKSRFQSITLAARGGGTGTNGQSLTDGLVVDLSRHMNRIIEINVEQGYARVEPGVVKDQLNRAALAYSLFFPPELSTSNRATIGGMISTDASGQGSCIYGKTRNHVQSVSVVMAGGIEWEMSPLTPHQLNDVCARKDSIGSVHRTARDIAERDAELIAAHFPPLNRSLTGYDLAHLYDVDGNFDLKSLICGSEGTLALIAEAKVSLRRLPAATALLIVRYESFDASLRDASKLVTLGASSIETIDSLVLELARTDTTWGDIAGYFPADAEGPANGVNIVEFIADSEAQLIAKLAIAKRALLQPSPGRRGHSQVGGQPSSDGGMQDGADIERVWAMRKRAVGLLGNMDGDARPVAFVEDTAVPPQHLADFIGEFRNLLDHHGLRYGMFGHVDAGVIHVRPALDLRAPQHAALIQTISQQVFALTKKYGGVFWGEHGKGLRSVFSPATFGPLYPALQEIKYAFDPSNQLNPGKIAAPLSGQLLGLNSVTTRGALARPVSKQLREQFGKSVHCNGNGACFDFDPDSPMCPSWKGTRDRRHSPKGRAELLREWTRRVAHADPITAARRPASLMVLDRIVASFRKNEDFSHAVKDALDGCLSCKACASQCPVKIDIPAAKATFLELYHTRYLRPLRDYLIASIETMAPLGARYPTFANIALQLANGRLVSHMSGLVNLPAFSTLSLRKGLKSRGIAIATPQSIASLDASPRERSVVIVQDAFTSFFDSSVVLDVIDFLRHHGFNPLVAPFHPNGKPRHLRGFLTGFHNQAAANTEMLKSIARYGIDLVGIDPAMTLTYRSEYRSASIEAVPRVHLLQEWLAPRLGSISTARTSSNTYYMLAHCTERTLAPSSMKDWELIFRVSGHELKIVNAGCCGMAGVYGHEREHSATSGHIFDLSWAGHLSNAPSAVHVISAGYSCRSQVKQRTGRGLLHPMSALMVALRGSSHSQ